MYFPGGIQFYEGDILVKTLNSEREKVEGYKLRHKVFSDGLKWVESTVDGLERDGYDSWATSIGLFLKGGRLSGIFRLLPTKGPFMLEKEFLSLLHPNYVLRKMKDTVEITRLTVDPYISDKGLSSRMMQILFKGVYQWSVQNDVRYLYMVIEKRFFRVFRAMGFPCEPLGPCKAFPPASVLSVAAILDLDHFRSVSRRKRPWLLGWISSVEKRNNDELGEYRRWSAETPTHHSGTTDFCGRNLVEEENYGNTLARV